MLSLFNRKSANFHFQAILTYFREVRFVANEIFPTFAKDEIPSRHIQPLYGPSHPDAMSG